MIAPLAFILFLALVAWVLFFIAGPLVLIAVPFLLFGAGAAVLDIVSSVRWAHR